MSIVTDIFLPIALAFIMFALGLGLTGADFLRVLKQPKDFFVGAISQIVLLPVIAFILISPFRSLLTAKGKRPNCITVAKQPGLAIE